MNYLLMVHYINGREEGKSPIKRFYRKVFYINGESVNKNVNSSPDSVYAELENSKKILLGFMDYNKRRFLINYL